MGLPIGVFAVLGEQIARLQAGEMRAAVLAAHSSNPRDLAERLHYQEFPEARARIVTDAESEEGWQTLLGLVGRKRR